MNIEAQERSTYEHVWQDIDIYGDHSPGVDRLPLFLDMAKPRDYSTVLDAGCGSGKGALALRARGFVVTLCDLTPAGLVDEAREMPFYEACLWRELPNTYRFGGVYDYVFCCDVMEHVPTALTMLAVARMLSVSRYGVFLSVGTDKDGFGLLAGKPLHQTVQPFPWWLQTLREVGTVREARDLIGHGAVFLVSR